MIAAAHGNLPAAAKHYLHALTLEPANTEIIRRASSLAQSLGRTHTRIALTEYVVARDPLDHLPHASLGFAYLDAGRLDEAIASIRIALQLNPERICAHSRIGIALLLKGDLEAALAEAAASQKRWRVGVPKGRLDGVPTAIKDLIETKGWACRRGSRASAVRNTCSR